MAGRATTSIQRADYVADVFSAVSRENQREEDSDGDITTGISLISANN